MIQELTKQEAIANHRKMWWWIAEETEKRQGKVEKSEYFRHIGIDPWDADVPNSQCYCCEYCKQYHTTCEFCPIDWDSETESFMCLDKEYCYDRQGLFAKWYDTYDWQEAARLTRAIAELPERKFEEK